MRKYFIILQTITLTMTLLIGSESVKASPEQELVPGGIALLPLPDYQTGTKVYFNDNRVAIFSNKNTWFAMAGIGLSTAPGNYAFSINQPDGTTQQSKITIKHKKYDEQHLTIKNKRKVNPNKQDTDRIIAESKRKKKAKTQYSATHPQIDFIWPTTGRISSIFGLRRFFNEQERNPHNGLDIATKEGTPIKTTADGIIIESGDFFFSGNMVFIDHGQGIISLYAHMSKIAVKTGDIVKQGDIIGSVGQTGRATGPHLHFAIIANHQLIDPILMLPKDGNPNLASTTQK